MELHVLPGLLIFLFQYKRRTVFKELIKQNKSISQPSTQESWLIQSYTELHGDFIRITAPSVYKRTVLSIPIEALDVTHHYKIIIRRSSSWTSPLVNAPIIFFGHCKSGSLHPAPQRANIINYRNVLSECLCPEI